jgi:hypothetical protein
MVAAFMAGSTFAYEGFGAAGTAWLLGTERGRQLAAGTNDLLDGVLKRISNNKIDIAQAHDVPLAAAAIVAMVLGTPALQVLKQVVDPARTREDNLKYGLGVATGVSVAVGGESYLAASGIVDLDPRFIGVAVVGLVTLIGVGAWGVRQLRNSEGEQPPLELDIPDQ